MFAIFDPGFTGVILMENNGERISQKMHIFNRQFLGLVISLIDVNSNEKMVYFIGKDVK